jgi:formate--tetrahydrofolate ligase
MNSSTRAHETSLAIAQAAELREIVDVAADLGLEPDELEPYGRFKAKVPLEALERRRGAAQGRLVCMTAITPTPAGEGKTTTAIALTDALWKLGARAALCLREPSLGPVFGAKGGAAGGGHAQVVPMEDINLHFTGDIHAIGAANNLLAAMLESHLMQGNELGIDPLTVTWRRCVDMDDRALRSIVVGLGGPKNGLPRETGFDITAASEVMAVVSVANDLDDLRRRLAAVTVAHTRDGRPVTAEDLHAAGPMTVLLKDAMKPNLVQTLEGRPAFVHSGPFANIALGTSSLIADRLGLALADYVVTESGFGADMGFEKFADIACRNGGLKPAAVVVVASVKAIRHHGGGSLEAGAANLAHNIGIVRRLGWAPVVAVNAFGDDDVVDLQRVRELALEAGAYAAEVSDGFGRGGAGALDLAEVVLEAATEPHAPRAVYPLDASIEEKLAAVATEVYGADAVELTAEAKRDIAALTEQGLDVLPVCMAKTPLSLSHDPALPGVPSGYALPIRGVRAYTGAGWLVAFCGDVLTMPGLPADPAAAHIDVDDDGRTVGLW